jgi:hypothetical protein
MITWNSARLKFMFYDFDQMTSSIHKIIGSEIKIEDLPQLPDLDRYIEIMVFNLIKEYSCEILFDLVVATFFKRFIDSV